MKTILLYLFWTSPVVFMIMKSIELIQSGSNLFASALIVVAFQFTMLWIWLFAHYFSIEIDKKKKK